LFFRLYLGLVSEYGPNSLEIDEQVDFPVWGKMAFRQYLESIGLPYYAIFCGLFAEWAEGFILGPEPEKNEARIVGKGDKKISFTALGDVADFIAVTTTSELRSSLWQAFIPTFFQRC
jgi:hypothetical protein